MWFSGLLLRCRRSPNAMFFSGVLIGMLAFWILDARRASEYLLVRNTDVYEDIIAPQNFRNDRNGSHHAVDQAVADRLKEKVRVFAVILTAPRTKLSKAVHVKATWAKRFNGYLFFSSEEDKELPSIRVAEIENRDALWEKVRRALIYVYQNALNDYDFFMKTDDDTYKYVKQGYASGGAGYVLSRAALKLVAEAMLKEAPGCHKRGGAEDVNLGVCAEAVGVKMVDSLDEYNREAFHPFRPSAIFDRTYIDRVSWIHYYNYFPVKTGLDCCSDHSVSFHYVSPRDMYVLELLMYHIYPYGITRDVKQHDSLKRINHTGEHKSLER
ncbi:unnamed protein product [Taenia asiatica]|uniref:N-acetylgalactosaminide beta-1,3-galactosyltransferase n=1 Tax=Taenia asiatica TaxID=60517 RepID=A0A0R3W6G3_TAEAS|nr:unnamed protein product [Taenia asiatica]